MSNNNSNASGGGIGFCGLLATVFITLKLIGSIAWSWWWVLAPLWVPIAFTALVLAGFVSFIAWHRKTE